MRRLRAGIIILGFVLLLGCKGEPEAEADSNPQGESSGHKLSAKAQSFLEAAERDMSDFHFSVSYLDYEAGTSTQITLIAETQRSNVGSAIVIERSEALEIVRYFAHSGMLDRTDVPPAGELLAGWNVSLGTKQVSAYWYLGRRRDALLKSQEAMGVRAVLGNASRNAWDELIQSIRKSESQQDAPPDSR